MTLNSKKFFSRILVLAAMVVLSMRAGVMFFYSSDIVQDISQLSKAEPLPVGIVLGARVRENGEPSQVLYDRVATAAELYHKGLVSRLLLSGVRTSEKEDETAAMKRTALLLGVPASALILDDASPHTYESCHRARHVFGIQKALLITQRFHLSRSLMLCRRFGIQSLGVPADRTPYSRRSLIYWHLREIPATLKAFLHSFP